ncbi:hypothetical protein BH10PSE1_BH10PSE1_32550 [soil metagenome]
MFSLDDLKRQHREIMLRATDLRGLGDMIKTRDDALEARAGIEGIDRMLIEHLTIEDDNLYPALLNCGDRGLAVLAADCAEEMGGILGAWVAYRDQWTAGAIMVDPKRFSAATAGVIGALALRVERENSELYPAMDAVLASSVKARFAVG